MREPSGHERAARRTRHPSGSLRPSPGRILTPRSGTFEVVGEPPSVGSARDSARRPEIPIRPEPNPDEARPWKRSRAASRPPWRPARRPRRSRSQEARDRRTPVGCVRAGPPPEFFSWGPRGRGGGSPMPGDRGRSRRAQQRWGPARSPAAPSAAACRSSKRPDPEACCWRGWTASLHGSSRAWPRASKRAIRAGPEGSVHPLQAAVASPGLRAPPATRRYGLRERAGLGTRAPTPPGDT